MVFGARKLQDEVFCLTEERDFFQGKYLEQVSEIVNLKNELRLARREISRLRGELMSNESNSNILTVTSPPKPQRPQADRINDEDNCSVGTESCSNSSITTNSDRLDPNDNNHDSGDHFSDDDDDDDDQKMAIRESAEKLLQWASFRTSAYSCKSPLTSQTISVPNTVPSPTTSIHEAPDINQVADNIPEDEEHSKEQQSKDEIPTISS